MRGAWWRAAALTLTVAAATAVLPVAARAEVAAADPIDAAMRTCLARGDMSSTAGQVQCMQMARLGWLAAGNVAYQQLQGKLPAAQRKAWEESQKRWETSRTAQWTLYDAVFDTTHGSSNELTEADMQLQPVRDRTLSLRSALANASAGASTSAPARLRPCSADAQCEHATFDMNRYYHRLQTRLPAHARPTLVKAQRAWSAYLEAASAVTDERGRVDIIGARVATLKRLSETVGNG